TFTDSLGNAPGFVEHEKLDYLGEFRFPGAMPQAANETAPLALPRDHESAVGFTLFGSERSESVAAAETSTTQERRAAHPRPSPARERSCHQSGCYRVGAGDRCHWTAHR